MKGTGLEINCCGVGKVGVGDVWIERRGAGGGGAGELGDFLPKP